MWTAARKHFESRSASWFSNSLAECARSCLSIPRLVVASRLGVAFELVVVGYDDAQREAVEALEPLSIEVLDLNLEDAFIEYTRGPRRSLPLFATELENVESARDQGAA